METLLPTIILNPNIALLLIAFGGAALLVELSAPGGFFSGLVGVLASGAGFYLLYALHGSPLAIIMIALALALVLGGVYAPAHGLLLVSGILLFIGGALSLFPEGAYAVSTPLLAGIAAALGVYAVTTLTALFSARRKRASTGREGLIGQVGRVRKKVGPEKEGLVAVAGELWRAYSPVPLDVEDHVRVRMVKGLYLEVTPVEPSPEEPVSLPHM